MKKIVFFAILLIATSSGSYSQNNNVTSYNSKFPLYSYYEYSWSASIYNKSEVAQQNIGSITLFLKNSINAKLENCEIYLASTENSSIDLSLINNVVKVFSGNIDINNNFLTINFNTPYEFAGENLVVYFVNNSNNAIYPMPEYVSKQSNVISTIYNYSVFANNTAEVFESNAKPTVVFNQAIANSIIKNEGNFANIYPNPVFNELQIANISGSINIYNSIGSLITSVENVTKIDVSNFSKGLYFIEYFQNNNLIRKQFIKE
ncbi:MAG: T9SS type A sorting domain-containing protein [Bacteroidota bacterium]